MKELSSAILLIFPYAPGTLSCKLALPCVFHPKRAHCGWDVPSPEHSRADFLRWRLMGVDAVPPKPSARNVRRMLPPCASAVCFCVVCFCVVCFPRRYGQTYCEKEVRNCASQLVPLGCYMGHILALGLIGPPLRSALHHIHTVASIAPRERG